MEFTFFKLEAEAIRQHTGSAGSFFTLKRYKKKRLKSVRIDLSLKKIPGIVLLVFAP